MRRHTPRDDSVHRVTTANRATNDGVDQRIRRYSITMAVRVLCILLAALLPIPLWSKGLFIVGAVVLPWIAVIGANGGDAVDRREINLVARTDRVQLSGPSTDAQPLVIDSTADERDPTSQDGGLRRRSA